MQGVVIRMWVRVVDGEEVTRGQSACGGDCHFQLESWMGSPVRMSKPQFSRKREADWFSTTRRRASTAAEVFAGSGGMSAILSFGAGRAWERVRFPEAIEEWGLVLAVE